MRPVFEDTPVGEQLIEVGQLIARVAVPQGVMMGSLNSGDRVDLDVAKVFDG